MKTETDTTKILSLSPRGLNALAVFLLCLVIVACYANSVRNGFVSDDHYIIESDHTPLSFQAAIEVFTTDDNLIETSHGPYYRPLTRFSFLIDEYFFGLNPAGYHIINIVLHAICVTLLFFALLRLEFGFATSFGAAVLFGVHPVNAEAVNFIVARNNILAAIFSLASLLAFLKAEESNKKKRWYILSGFLFFLGALSKETGLMIIPLLVFLKIYRERSWRDVRNILTWDMSFILFHVLFFGVYVHLRLFAIANNYIQQHMAGVSGVLERLQQLSYIVPAYFSMAVFPLGLNNQHQMPDNFRTIMLPLLLKWFILCAAVLYLFIKRNKTIIIAAVWLILNLIPIINIVPIPSSTRFAERYFYLPLMGFLVIVADVLARFLRRRGSVKIVVSCFLPLTLILGTMTFNHNFKWRDDLAVSRNIVDNNQTFPYGHFSLGYQTYILDDHATAEKEFKKAIELAPRSPEAAWALYYLAAFKYEANDPKNGERYLREAFESDPRNSTVKYALAVNLWNKDRKASVQFLRRFLGENALPNFHRIIEVKNLLPAGGIDQKIKSLPVLMRKNNDTPGDHWTLIKRYPSGTELLYNSSSIQKEGKYAAVEMAEHLTKSDRLTYAFRLLRFPVAKAVEARYLFNINCQQHLLKMESMEFIDDLGNTIGKCWPHKEDTVMYEYLFPQTMMRKFSEKICRND